MDYRALAIVPLAALVFSVSAAAPRLPDGWHEFSIAHSAKPEATKAYDIGLTPGTEAAGTPTLTIRSTRPAMQGRQNLGALTQPAYGYGGQRVRFCAELRAEGAASWAGLVLTPGDGSILNRVAQGVPGIEHQLPPGSAVTANGGWQPVSVVMDVPADVPMISVGLALVGEGQLWARHLSFDVVGRDVPTTSTAVGIDWAQGRQNLAESRRVMAQVPPMPLVNAHLD
jgi:hypothetical protein